MVGAGGIPRRWEDGGLDAVFAPHARPSYVPCILCPVKRRVLLELDLVLCNGNLKGYMVP